ncbi:MAG: uroporphyrinogen-III C-methyltransferase [Pseudomonadota bacterium]
MSLSDATLTTSTLSTADRLPGRVGALLRMLFAPLLRASSRTDNARPIAPARPVAMEEPGRRGFVSLVGAGPGSADLITLRGVERLKAADIVFYDRLVDPALLAHTGAGTRCIYVGKAPGAHAWTQDRINEALVEAAASGLRAVRLKCGDPGVFARGAEEAAALSSAGLDWEIVPGVTAAASAAAAAGSFLTARGETDTLVLTTGRLAECPVLNAAGDAPDWSGLLRPGTTLAVYMGVAASRELQARLLAAGMPADLPVEIVHAAGTTGEAIHRTTLEALEATIRDRQVRNPAMILIRRPKMASARPAHAAERLNAG